MTEREAGARPPRRLRFGLFTLLLTIAAAAIWIAYYRLRVELHEIRQQLPSLRLFAGALIVEDEGKYAAVKRLPVDNDLHWRVHLPRLSGGKYLLRIASTDILFDNAGTPSLPGSELPESSFFAWDLTPGCHEISVLMPDDYANNFADTKMVEARVSVDGVVVSTVKIPASLEMSSTDDEISDSRQQSTAKPLVLIRAVDLFSEMEFMVWVEKSDASDD